MSSQLAPLTGINGEQTSETEPEEHELVSVGHSVREIHPGDLIFFTRKRIHALVRAAGDYSDDATTAPLRPERVDLVWVDGYDRAFRTRNIRREILEAMAHDNRIRLIDEELENRTAINRAPGVRYPDRYHRDATVQPGPRLPVSNLTFRRIYSLNRVNGFLKHPIIDHKQGRVQKAKGIFIAERPDGKIAAALTLNSVNARMAFDRRTVEITRYASHPEVATPSNSTNNTATWMLSRVCRWAALEGYETVKTFAGTDGNHGQIYEAANFSYDGVGASSGNYNRDGRQNQSHSQPLRRYIRDVDMDGDNATSGGPRRFDGRLEANSETTGNAVTLSNFTACPSDATPSMFRFTREEASDYKFTAGPDADSYPVFSDRLKTLLSDTNAPIKLPSLVNGRGRNTPAAVFGATVNDSLVAALLVSGDPSDRIPVARVESYVARETAYPDATARWLLTRARDWSELDGYDSLVIPAGTFEHVPRVNDTVPEGVGFTNASDGTYYYPSSSTPIDLPDIPDTEIPVHSQ